MTFVTGFIQNMVQGFLNQSMRKYFVTNGAKKKIPFQRQQPIPLIHEEIKMDAGFRADMIIDNKVILEFKSVEQLAPVHYKQLQTYLKLTNCKLGLLINFNVALIKEGIHRVVNKL